LKNQIICFCFWRGYFKLICKLTNITIYNCSLTKKVSSYYFRLLYYKYYMIRKWCMFWDKVITIDNANNLQPKNAMICMWRAIITKIMPKWITAGYKIVQYCHLKKNSQTMRWKVCKLSETPARKQLKMYEPLF